MPNLSLFGRVKASLLYRQGYRIWIFRGRLAGETPFLTVNFGQLRPPASEYQGDSTGNVRRKSQEIPIWILKIFICDSPAYIAKNSTHLHRR